MGGKNQPVGTEMVNANGYRNVKVQNSDGTTGWRLVHHVVAEEKILKRALRPDERVVFIDPKQRQNVHPENLKVVKRGVSSTKRREAQLSARIEELLAQYKDLTGKEYKRHG
jgi:hypothetical protein